MNARETLRAVTLADSDLLYRWRNDPRLRAVMTDDAAIARDEHDRWFAASLAGARDLSVYAAGDKALGVVAISGIDRVNAHARWGFYLCPDGAPPGSGSRMCWLALERAFGSLALHRLGAEVLANNERSLRLHRKLGFAQEGVLRDYLYRDGERRDMILFSQLAPNWTAVAEDLRKELFP